MTETFWVKYESEIVKAFNESSIMLKFFGPGNIKKINAPHIRYITNNLLRPTEGYIDYTVKTNQVITAHNRILLTREAISPLSYPIELDTARIIGNSLAEIVDINLWNGVHTESRIIDRVEPEDEKREFWFKKTVRNLIRWIKRRLFKNITLVEPKADPITIEGINFTGISESVQKLKPGGNWGTGDSASMNIQNAIDVIRNKRWDGVIDILVTRDIYAFLYSNYVTDKRSIYPITYLKWLKDIIRGYGNKEGKIFVSNNPFIEKTGMFVAKARDVTGDIIIVKDINSTEIRNDMMGIERRVSVKFTWREKRTELIAYMDNIKMRIKGE